MNIHSLLWGKILWRGLKKGKGKGTEQYRFLDARWFVKAPNTSLCTESPQEMKGLFLPNDFISVLCGAFKETRLTLLHPTTLIERASSSLKAHLPLCLWWVTLQEVMSTEQSVGRCYGLNCVT